MLKITSRLNICQTRPRRITVDRNANTETEISPELIIKYGSNELHRIIKNSLLKFHKWRKYTKGVER